MNDVLIYPKEICINEHKCGFCDDVVYYNKIKKKPTDDESKENDPNSECIICFEKNKSPIVTCSLCSNYSHYTCYKKFIKKMLFIK